MTCVALLPHKRALVERHSDRPFAFIGMYGRAGDPAEIAARLERGNVGWRNALDLGEVPASDPGSGPLWSRWAARGYPQFYLLDERGTILAKWFGDPGDELDRAVEAALARMKSAR